MECPVCHRDRLKPVRLAPHLPAMGCAPCGGYLLSMLDLRLWLDEHPAQGDANPDADVTIQDSASALGCPKCQRLMRKYRIDGKLANRLDLCEACGEIWFDGGEWQQIERLGLQARLPQVFSWQWQQDARLAQIHELQEAEYRQRFGEDYAKIRGFRDWLDQQPDRDGLLGYLNRPMNKKSN